MAEGSLPMGVGVNQRGLIKMSPAEVDAFLDESRVMTMCTLNHDGTIHAVAMWFGFVDGLIAIETKAEVPEGRRTCGEIPTMTCLFEAGDELRGAARRRAGGPSPRSSRTRRRCSSSGVSHFERYHGAYDESKRRPGRGDAAQAHRGRPRGRSRRLLGPPQAGGGLRPWTSRATERIAAPRAEVLDALVDPALLRRISPPRSRPSSRPSCSEPAATRDGIVTLKVRYAFAGELSGPAKMAIDARKLTWVIHTRLDLASHRAVLDIVPDHYADLVVCDGEVSFVEDGEETLETIEGSLVVKIPLIGSTAERVIIDGLLKHLGDEAAALGEFCAGPRPA